MTARVAALYVYPVKSCRGIGLASATLTSTGFAHDREWLIVDARGRFMTQREMPRLALIETALEDDTLCLRACGARELRVALDHGGAGVTVTCWEDRCAAFDAGEPAAQWLSTFLSHPCRLVRFDRSAPRASDARWTGAVVALNHFTDGFPIMVLGSASVADLEARVGRTLPVDRFRPNILLDGVAAYEEDEIAQLQAGGITLGLVKPCIRCVITATDQRRGERDGDEPLRTLRGYRWSTALRGVMFGQNAILLQGVGQQLAQGATLQSIRSAPGS